MKTVDASGKVRELDAATRPRVALTFEAGGDPAPTTGILDALNEASVRATFFLDGSWAQSQPALVRLIAARGHELGNHGFRHPDWTTLNDEEIRADLRATEELVANLTGGVVKPWARPPYGAINPRVQSILAQEGYHVVYRDAVDGGHWPGETNVNSIHTRAMQSAVDGGVVVFHTNRPDTARALPMILRDLTEGGFRLGPLSDLGVLPSPRMERHTDFADLAIDPGYLRPHASGRWSSLNLFELGALARRQTNYPEPVATLDGAILDLLTGDAVIPMTWTEDQADRHILVLAGELRCDLRSSDDRDLGYLLARSGDLFLCPRGIRYRLGPSSPESRRWIALIWRASDSRN